MWHQGCWRQLLANPSPSVKSLVCRYQCIICRLAACDNACEVVTGMKPVYNELMHRVSPTDGATWYRVKVVMLIWSGCF